MKPYFTKKFQKLYKKRIQTDKSLDQRFGERLELFLADRINPTLKDHGLKGSMLGLRAFSVTGNIRAIYYIENDTVYFTDIGTHNQVYK